LRIVDYKRFHSALQIMLGETAIRPLLRPCDTLHQKLLPDHQDILLDIKTTWSSVRYGNVVGSRGSVVPYFRHLIDQGSDHLPITDERMTRFWITLQQGVDFVLKGFQRMQGGEIFVPKIPSVRITDLARAMAPDLPHKIVGIRPGEKLHEVLCPTDDSHLTLEFDDHFVNQPGITIGHDADYSVNLLGEFGRPVDDGFQYQSGQNSWFLDVDQIQEVNNLVTTG
jgi:UDP-N-acetylglucosamine 4,6-dehydratase